MRTGRLSKPEARQKGGGDSPALRARVAEAPRGVVAAPQRGSTLSGSGSGGFRGAGQRGRRRRPAQRQGSGPHLEAQAPCRHHAHPSGCLLSTHQCQRLGSRPWAHLPMLTEKPCPLSRDSAPHLPRSTVPPSLDSRPSAGASPNTERTPVGPLCVVSSKEAPCHASFRRKDGRTLGKATRAEQPQLKIYTALDLHPAPGGVTKLIA